MSRKYKPKLSRFTEANQEPATIPPGGFYKHDDDESDEEDEMGIPISPGGSVLTPARNPYNMLDRIREANRQLEKEKKQANLHPRTPKVRFIEPETVEEEEFVEDESAAESKPSKILLVTLPTAYSKSEEIYTDDDYEDDLDFTYDDFRGSRSDQEPSFTHFYESEEELEDNNTLPLTEETLTSSLETVICRSETEESELTECFTKSINLNTENESMNSLNLDDNHLDCKESVSKPNATFESIEIQESSKVTKEDKSIENSETNMNNIGFSKIQNFSVSKNSTPDPSAPKYDRKLAINIISKKDPATDSCLCTSTQKRKCCRMSSMAKLPAYNGLRSEYGLTKEQLFEREKKKCQLTKALKIEKEKKYLEERQKQKDNEVRFKNWLIKKKKEAEAKTLRRLCQRNYCFRVNPAPTSHLDKIGILRRKMLKRENTYLLLDEIFKNARPQEQRTYRIYLGLCV